MSTEHTDTPETDAQTGPRRTSWPRWLVLADFARKLERERNEARRDRDALKEFFDANPSHLAQEAIKLRARVAELEQWKTEQLAVESQWDPQMVASLLGIELGENIRTNIELKIKELRTRITELEKDKERLDKLSEMAWVVIANVSQGDWQKSQSSEWIDCARRWESFWRQTIAAKGNQ